MHAGGLCILLEASDRERMDRNEEMYLYVFYIYALYDWTQAQALIMTRLEQQPVSLMVSIAVTGHL